jgi:hypothetical protein
MCRTMQKRRVQVNGLRGVQNIGTGISRSGQREMVLTFENTSGVAGLEGRETMVRLTGGEVAMILGAFPARDLGHEGLFSAYRRVLSFLKSW